MLPKTGRRHREEVQPVAAVEAVAEERVLPCLERALLLVEGDKGVGRVITARVQGNVGLKIVAA